jgi:hypothetical protein
MSEKRKLIAIPKFKSEREEANFWATHDTTEYSFEDLEETIVLGPELRGRIETRRQERLQWLLKLDEENFKTLQDIAVRKNIDELSLLKRWVEEGIKREMV